MATPVGLGFSGLRSSGSWPEAPGQSHTEMKTSATEPERRTFLLISSQFVFLAAIGIGNCFMHRGLRFFRGIPFHMGFVN